MRVLLDTHAFLWFITRDKRLPDLWLRLIRDPDNAIFLSVVSVWEATIKHQLGKLPMPQDLPFICRNSGSATESPASH